MTAQRSWVAYLAAAVAAEVLFPITPLVTAAIHAIVLVAALSQFGWALRQPLSIGDPSIRVLPAIALIPLLRLLSLTLPFPELPPITWIALIGVPLLVAVVAAADLAVLDLRQIGLTTAPHGPWSIAVIGFGIPLGIVLAGFAPPALVLPSPTLVAAAISATILVAFAVIPEELIFRGTLQPLLVEVAGRWGVPIAAAAWAVTYAGSESIAAVAVIFAAGLVYGWERMRSGSVWAPLISHSLAALTTQLVVIRWS